MRLGHPDHYAPWLERAHQQVRALLLRLPPPLAEFIIFGFKQAWSCLFGGAMLALIIASKLVWQQGWAIARYDFLAVAAILIQILLIATKLETWSEARVIAIFHVVGTAMEIFKTHMGSWIYPEDNFLRIGGVPLFTGFMYACVGSYLARSTRLLELRYTNYPPLWATLALALAIYVNFFTHHFAIDIRLALFAATVLLFARTRVYFLVDKDWRWMPLLLGFILIALFIWFAENIGTFSATWVYPTQKAAWHIVSPGKLGAWFLLMIISFVLVSLVHRPKVWRAPAPAPVDKKSAIAMP